MAQKFSISITVTAILLAAVFWMVVTAWDAVIDHFIYNNLPWDAESWQAKVVAALLLTGVAIILLLMERNFGEFVGIEVIPE